MNQLQRFTCPVCNHALEKNQQSFSCINNHHFDIAREGYVNLLLANQKKSQEPGDNKQMIAHRRQFFTKGFYDPVAAKINKSLLQDAVEQQLSQINLLDCGCGEGYFLQQLQMAGRDANLPVNCWGVDISKFAVKYAAKQDKVSQWAVASIYKLPLLSESMDYILNIMAPHSAAEFCRILKPNGRLLVVTPGPQHLFHFREQLYEQAETHQAAALELDGLTQLTQQQVQYRCTLDAPAIENLFVMTPYFWNASAAVQEKIRALPSLEVEVDFQLTLFQKTA